ncbi:MAG: M20/M25/M40 family metallo-hydrolase [Spirochaetaceae bacterium]
MIDIKLDIVEVLSSLISVESETNNEKLLCDMIYSVLSNYNGELIRVSNSLVLHMDFGKQKRIGLVGHIDTVPVAKSSTIPTIKDGALWGRGACDMKSGIACMLKVLNDIDLGLIEPNHNLTLVFYEKEEGPCPNGINYLLDAKHLDNLDFAYVLEPTEGKYSVGCLGSLAVKKEVYGISAHSANSKRGKNALLESMEIYSQIDEMNNEIDGITDIDGYEYYETVNVTALHTDTKTFNVIPAKVEMLVNYRFSPDKSSRVALAYLLEHLGQDNITVVDQADSCFIGSSGDLFLLDGVEREIMQAWTDIAQLNVGGVPAVNFGAGSIKVAHKPEERIVIKELKEFYTLLVKHL